MRRKTILFILTVLSLSVTGQTHFIGFQGGLNLTNIYAEAFFKDDSYRKGISSGINYELVFSDKYSVGVDLLYNQNGFQEKIIYRDNSGNEIITDIKTKFNYDYLSLPIKFGYQIGNKFKGFAKIGIIPSLLINAKTIVPNFDTDGNITEWQALNVFNDVSKFDFAGLFEIGIGYKLIDRIG
jgi:opacity protein-like surface antigen